MYKTKLLAALVTTAIIGFRGYTLNASAATATGTANATIQTPLSIVNNLTMEFGDIAPDAAGGTVTVNANTGIVSGPAGFIVNLTGTRRAGRFTVTGEPGLSYAISFGAGPFVLTGLGADMTLNNFTTSIASPSTLVGATEIFDVGADLIVNANQTPDSYSGTYDVIVNYQ